MLALDLNHVAAKLIRAEVPIIRHNTKLKGRMVIDCGTPGPGFRKCKIRVYSRTHDRLKATILMRWKPVPKHKTVMFEDYSGWITVDGQTLLVNVID
jgi:hypothetical protein